MKVTAMIGWVTAALFATSAAWAWPGGNHRESLPSGSGVTGEAYFQNAGYDNNANKRRILHQLPSRIVSPGEKVFVFSPKLKAWAAYDADGYRVASGIANGGQSYCPDLGRPCFTPKGKYRVLRKGNSRCVSRKFDNAPMPYCMFFKGGYAIHGSPYISNRNGSHGCIRVTTDAARWLSQNFIDVGTRVVVLSY